MTRSVDRSASKRILPSPTLLIVVLGISIRLIHNILLYILSRILPPFDSSHTLLSSRNLPGLRWDAIHFVSIAEHGYTHEQQLAFQPLFMALLWITGECSAWMRGGRGEVDVGDIVWGGMGISAIAWVTASIMLHKLTIHLYNPKFALLTTLLYMLPPSPVPSLPYTEPLYALTTFSGMYLLIVKRQYMLCGLLFACSTGIRATGIFNVLILGGVGLLEGVPVRSITAKLLIRRIITRSYRLIIPCLLTIMPFLLFQWYAYQSFCTGKAEDRRPWCESRLPFAYGFVQKEYWNIGFLNYWTIPNIPNILLPLPIFLISFWGIKRHLASTFLASRQAQSQRSELLVLYIHHTLMVLLLLLNSHTQILLRTCITDPVIWWNIAGLAVDWGTQHSGDQDRKKIGDRPGELRLTRIGKYWIGWCVIWSTVSSILWAGHYPPA